MAESESSQKSNWFIRHKWITLTAGLLCLTVLQDYFISPRFAHKAPKIDDEARRQQNATFERNCVPKNYEPSLFEYAKLPESICVCKPFPFWKKGCASRLELFSRKPFVLKVHGSFAPKAKKIGKYADMVTMRPVMLGNEYGHSWVSPYINSEDGVMVGEMPIVQEIYHELSRLTGMVYPCGGKPGAAIVRYHKGGFVGLHYDAPDLRVEKTLGYWLGAQIFRSAMAWLEDCRHFYSEYNIWKCLYMASQGKIERSTSWNNYAYGPQVATIMIQLSNLDGGETFFPLVNLTVPTTNGDVLIWGNINDDWQREPNSMHGGCPVLSNEKLIVVVFMPGKCNSFSAIIKDFTNPAHSF